MAEKLTKEQFTLRALDTLPKGESASGKVYKGVHTVYQGFNEAFRTYFPDSDPVAWIKEAAKAGLVVTIPTKGGVRFYKPEDAPAVAGRDALAVLAKMGL
jgi:hypothetical protein